MNQIFQQKMAVVMNQAPMTTKQQTLMPDEKKKLTAAYLETFFGLAMTNWLRGKTLGAAWYDAIGQMDSFIKTKNQNNPAAMHLAQFHGAQRVKWNKLAMTSNARDEKIEISAEQIDAMRKLAAQYTSRGLDKMNATLAKYNALAKTAPQKFNAAQLSVQDMIKIYMAQQMERQHN